MSASGRLLDLAVSELAGELAESPHPSLDDLAAYYRRSLPEADARAVQDHLLVCPECTALLLDLDELAAIGREEAIPASPGEEADAEWERLKQRLEPVSPAAPKPLPFRARPRRAPVWLQAAAAALLVSTGTLAYRVADLRRTVGELTAPQVNSEIVELASSPLRGEANPREVRLRQHVEQLLVFLRTPPNESFPAYQIVVARSAGGPPFSIGGAQPDSRGTFTLTLSRQWIGDGGDFDITVFGLADGRREVVTTYSLRLATNATL